MVTDIYHYEHESWEINMATKTNDGLLSPNVPSSFGFDSRYCLRPFRNGYSSDFLGNLVLHGVRLHKL